MFIIENGLTRGNGSEGKTKSHYNNIIIMYYPYLRGKQFELIALREFSQENPTPTHVCPIIEPVKASINSLKTAINTMIGKDMQFALVLNPHDGDFRRISIDLYSQLEELVANPSKWIPAFIYKNNLSEIKNTILHHNLGIFS